MIIIRYHDSLGITHFGSQDSDDRVMISIEKIADLGTPVGVESHKQRSKRWTAWTFSDCDQSSNNQRLIQENSCS